ncbi:MAG: Rrf2 family transcriptional regulator [Candidatus Zixiibacteriota bacterium]|nr:MAG: Rrf2 family transcriptional regulator [candidate division Zixibacteria bacterium]
MKVTALEEYGLRCMLLFAGNDNRAPLTLPKISTAEGLSLPYAGKLLMILKKAGLVRAVRGRNGGYSLTKPAHEITLQEILAALGNSLHGSHHCDRFSVNNEDCIHTGNCVIGGIWSTFDNYIQGMLANITLADIALGKFGLQNNPVTKP